MTLRFHHRQIAALGTIGLGLFFWWGGVKGNDTGGIIAWAPGVEETALNTASDHCARYGKYAVITSVHPWPGDYIGFVCRRPDRWGPVSR
jgi:hypothetical protein